MLVIGFRLDAEGKNTSFEAPCLVAVLYFLRQLFAVFYSVSEHQLIIYFAVLLLDLLWDLEGKKVHQVSGVYRSFEGIEAYITDEDRILGIKICYRSVGAVNLCILDYACDQNPTEVIKVLEKWLSTSVQVHPSSTKLRVWFKYFFAELNKRSLAVFELLPLFFVDSFFLFTASCLCIFGYFLDETILWTLMGHKTHSSLKNFEIKNILQIFLSSECL